MVNSGQFNGMKNEDAKKAIVDYLAEKGMGEMKDAHNSTGAVFVNNIVPH